MKPSLPAVLLLLVAASQSRGQESISNIKQLTLPRFSYPTWSPDGSSIIYNRRLAGERIYTIRMMAFDGSCDREVLSDGELNSYAQMSPDGRWLVFDKWQDNEETNGEIYVLELESGDLTRLTRNEGIYDGYPTWYPDGERVLYASAAEGTFKLFSIRIDGTDRRQVTFGPGSDARPDVSGDGRRILFNREVNGTINIHVLEPEG